MNLRESASSTGGKLLELEQALNRLGGSKPLFNEFVQIFQEDSPAMVNQVQEGIEAEDADSVWRSAHALKGLSSNFGAQPFVAILRDIESAAKANDLSSVIAGLPKMQRLYKQLCDELAENG